VNSTDLGDLRVAAAAGLVLLASIGLVVMVQGATRARSVSTGAARFAIQFAAAALGFALIGFAVGFGPGDGWVSTEWYGLDGVDLSSRSERFDGVSVGGWLVLHLAAAVVFVGIALAPLAERTKVSGHGAAAALCAVLVFPFAARSAWGPGLLADIDLDGAGFVDHAGAGVVAVLAGWVGLTGSMLIGPRLGRFGPTGRARVIPGRSIPVAIIGAFVFLVGWAGLAVGRHDAGAADVGHVLLVLVLASAAGTIAAMLVSWRRSGRAGALSAARGLVAGLISMTAAPLAISPLWAVVVGGVAGGIAILAVVGLERARVDDPLGAVGMFGASGLWGSLAVGLFAEAGGEVQNGLVYGGGADQLVAQAVGLAILSAWGIVAGGAVFGLLRSTHTLRLSDEEELVGLSISDQSSV